ncbi:UNVERIFIED_CONTAM: hypothetical protein GTU68_024385 [Idotea baltica]|nr:hypothetical protein [Idotea baltica]
MSANDFQPTARIDILKRRSVLLANIRNFFHSNDYWEVETPLLSHDTVVDAHLDPFRVATADDSPQSVFLQTSPEFAMKRLIASGADRIYQITKSFRRGELGKRHNPEFTMAEWYAVGETYHEQMDFVEGLLRSLQDFDDQPFARVTYADAFAATFATDVIDMDASQLTTLANAHQIDIPTGTATDRDALLNVLLAEQVEPQLGIKTPAFLYDYPASQSALAQVRNESPPVAERFELYIDGIEFCNGYQELTDANELRHRITRENSIRVREGFTELPANSRLLNAMDSGLPGCSGVALGIDRLAMWLFDCDSLSDVIAFPFDRA